MTNKEYLTYMLMRDGFMEGIRNELDGLLSVIPELKSMIGFLHCHPHHHLDVWEHTLLALSLSHADLEIRLALLLHDSGKPHCYQQDGSIRHYNGHAEKSAEIAETVLTRLGFDEGFVSEVKEIVRLHDTPLTVGRICVNPDMAKRIFEVQRCDTYAHDPQHNERRLLYLKKTEALLGAGK